MTLSTLLGGKKSKRVVRKSKPKAKSTTVKRRTVKRHVGGVKSVAKRAKVTRVVKVAVRGRVKGKPRGDGAGARYVGKVLREERAKKGSPLTIKERSVIFKRAWAEHKARKGKK